jgi:type I restriction enzyme S subunit
MKEDNMKQGWELKKLGEVCEVIGGSTPKTNESTYWDGDYFWVTPAELDGTKLISSTKRTITEAGVKSAHLQLLPAGTVLLSSRAPIGKVAITTVPMYCNQGFKNLICSDKLYNCYAYWFLYANTEYLNALGTGATFKEISKKVVEQIPIPVPPLPVQEQIVSELDLLSGIIEKKRKQLKELDALAQSIFYDMFGDIHDSKGFDKKTLSELCTLITDGTHQTPTYTDDTINGYKFLSAKDVTEGVINWNNIKYIPKELHEILHVRLAPQRGDLLLCKNGTTGICALVETDEVFDIYVSLALLRPNNDINKKYLLYAINIKGTKSQFEESLKGVGVPNLHLGEIRKTKVILPPLPLQHQFASKIEAIERQKELIKQSISETETLFNERMQHYFS